VFDRLKKVLVETFIGAIALGYLFAEAILFFVNIFTASLAVWVARNSSRPSPFPLEAALRPAVAFVVLLLVWFVLLRWLYFTPVKKEQSAPNPEEAT